MKSLWLYNPNNSEEFADTLIMESENEDIEALKKRGNEIAIEKNSPNCYWVKGPNNFNRFEMMLTSGLLLVIK